jgi:ATP-dependent DNA helicase RecG
MARISDVNILEMARDEAVRLFEKDPDLKLSEHQALARELVRVWPKATEWS